MPKPELIDLTMHLHTATFRAIMVSNDGNLDKAVWLPKSQVEVEVIKDNTVEVTMPEWLAMEKGLI